jgi:malonyl CoA-acyl carrier protein transacylase
MCISSIEQYTRTTIQFPNRNEYKRRTSVVISGSPAQVCQARKLFDVRIPFLCNEMN